MPRGEIIVSVFAGHRRAALLLDGSLAKLGFGDGGPEVRRGDIVLGRVNAVSRDLGAAFVDIGEKRDGILMLGEPAARRKAVSEGDALVLRTLRQAIDGKGAKLTTSVALPGRFLNLTPALPDQPAWQPPTIKANGPEIAAKLAGLDPGAHGWSLRPAAAFADADLVLDEARDLLAAWKDLLAAAKTARAPHVLWRALDAALAFCIDADPETTTRFVCDDPETADQLRRRAPDLAARIELLRPSGSAFAVLGIDEQIESALAPEVALPGGGRLLIAETAGLASIDVDTGARKGGSGERTALKVNLTAAATIGREVQLRDLSGTIVIDFVPLRRAEHRAQVAAALRQAFDDDDRQVRIGGFTRMGLFEMRRERFGPSLSRRLQAACPACSGTGRITSLSETARAALAAVRDQTTGRACRSVRLIAAEPLLSLLRGDARAELADTEARLGRAVELAADPSFALDRYRIEIVPTRGESVQ